MMFRLFVLFFISPLFFGWSFQSALSHSLSSVVDTLAFHLKEGRSLKAVRQDVMEGLKTFEDSLPQATTFPRAMRKKKSRNPQSYGGGKSFPVDAEMAPEVRRLLRHIISAQNLGELKKRYARHQAFLGKGEGRSASPKMQKQLRRLGVSVPSEKPKVEKPKVNPKLSLRAVFNGSKPTDHVVDYLDPESAAALSQVNRSLSRWSKASTPTSASKGNKARRGHAGGAGGAGASEGVTESKGAALDAVVAASEGETTDPKKIFRILRSQKELAQVLSMTESQLGTLEDLIKSSASDRQVFNRAGLARRLDALQQVIAAEKNYQQSLRAEANASVKAFTKDPLKALAIPDEVNRAELVSAQQELTQARVAAIEALEREGVIVPHAPHVKAQQVYLETLSDAEVTHYQAKQHANKVLPVLKAKQRLHRGKVNKASTLELADAEGNRAYYQARLDGKDYNEADLEKEIARVKVLKDKRGPVSKLADAEGNRAYFQARVDEKDYNEADLKKEIARVKVLRSRRGPVLELADAEGNRAYFQTIVDKMGYDQANLEKEIARIQVLKDKRGPVSELAKAEGSRARAQALIDEKKYYQADLEGAIARIKFLKDKRGPVSELINAEGDRAYYQALVDEMNDNQAHLKRLEVRIKTLKGSKSPVSELAIAEGNRAYYQARIDGSKHRQAWLKGAKAHLEVLRSRKAPISELAKAEGNLAYYQVLTNQMGHGLAELEQATVRADTLRRGRASVSKLAEAEGNLARVQALTNEKTSGQANLEGAIVRIKVLKDKRASVLELTEAEGELSKLQDSID